MVFGHRRVEVGQILRDAIFVNVVLTISEAWHSITIKKNIEELKVMDSILNQYIIGAMQKQNKNVFVS